MKRNVNEDQKILANDTITAACPTIYFPIITTLLTTKMNFEKLLDLN